MRCFVAVDLSAEVQAAVVRLQARVRATAPHADVRWTAPAGLHLTLKFLGRVDPARAAALVGALGGAAAGSGPLALAVGGMGGFPSLHRARVLWVGVATGAPALTRLAAAVDAALAPLGFAAEPRPFHAHVTLARVRSPRGLAPLVGAFETAPAPDVATWTAPDVVLYQSHLRPTGAVYQAVARLPFGAGDG